MCAFLGLGRILHLQPPNDFVNQIIQTLIFNVQTTQNILLLQAALKCIYNTVKFSKIHTNYILQLKLVPLLQTIIDKAFDEKISLISLQILKELALNGYAMTFMDAMLCNSLVRIIN
jgi:hypothetical protein